MCWEMNQKSQALHEKKKFLQEYLFSYTTLFISIHSLLQFYGWKTVKFTPALVWPLTLWTESEVW